MLFVDRVGLPRRWWFGSRMVVVWDRMSGISNKAALDAVQYLLDLIIILASREIRANDVAGKCVSYTP